MHARLLLALTIIIAVPSARTRAAVISQDWHNSGDGLLTYDTINHREWLDLSQTFGQSLADVDQSLAPSGFLHAFQYATTSDVAALATSAGYIGTDPYSSQDFATANQLIEVLGQSVSYVSDSTPDQSITPYDKPLPTVDKIEQTFQFTSGLALVGAPRGLLLPFAISTEITGWYIGDAFHLDYQVSKLGGGLDGNFALTHPPAPAYWLYRDAPVPEPSSEILFLLAGCTGAIFPRTTKPSWHNRLAF